jgi:hypothetical protein
MGRLFRVILQLVLVAVVIFILTAVLVVMDGLNDHGTKADIALVLSQPDGPHAGADPLLNYVVKLYHEGDFPAIIVFGSAGGGVPDEPALMARYLESHGIAASAIIENHGNENTPGVARRVAEIMRENHAQSVMIIADYFRMTRMKLVLNQNEITDVDKAHVGKFQKEDVPGIAREVVALYDYVGTTFLLPAAEKVKSEAQVGLDNVRADAEKAKVKVDKSVDSLPK